MLINYNHVYIGASLAVLIKCLFERKKTLIIEKSNYLGEHGHHLIINIKILI